MWQRLSQQPVRELIAAAPACSRMGHSFELPARVYMATAALYLACIGAVAGLFLNPELAIPMVIFAGFVILVIGVAGRIRQLRPTNTACPPIGLHFVRKQSKLRAAS